MRNIFSILLDNSFIELQGQTWKFGESKDSFNFYEHNYARIIMRSQQELEKFEGKSQKQNATVSNLTTWNIQYYWYFAL